MLLISAVHFPLLSFSLPVNSDARRDLREMRRCRLALESHPWAARMMTLHLERRRVHYSEAESAAFVNRNTSSAV